MLNKNIQFMIDDMEDWVDEYVYQEYGIKNAAWDIDETGRIYVVDGESVEEDYTISVENNNDLIEKDFFDENGNLINMGDYSKYVADQHEVLFNMILKFMENNPISWQSIMENVAKTFEHYNEITKKC